MTLAIVVLCAVIGVGFAVILYIILCGNPKESLDEQERCIRQNAEDRAAKKRLKEEKRRRKEE